MFLPLQLGQIEKRLTKIIPLDCKYEPCVRCKPAIEEQEKKCNIFMFFAFIENYKAFKKYIEAKQQKLINKPKYLYTFISWFTPLNNTSQQFPLH